MNRGELRLSRHAHREAPAIMRHTLAAFLTGVGVGPDEQIDIVTAVGEALANAVEHAYGQGAAGELEMRASTSGDSELTVTVADRGQFARPHGRTDRGFGLRIIRAIARSVDVEARAGGTVVSMLFDASPAL
ncbi:MAG TPA: ATP-binding protein [Candidatus Acidoferrales bacterium]|nr:ATP-binding protein [Candidatus Acidoferrales bacterium]